MPQAYITQLSKLQDSVPAAPFTEVSLTIQRELGMSLDAVFEHLEPVAIAAASIAQVHVGRLKATNEKVAVKVQHQNVRVLIMDDFRSLLIIISIACWLEPDFSFLRLIMKEYVAESKKELDFRIEAENQKLAADELAKSGLCVLIPQCHGAYTTPNLLVMEFAEGFKVTDKEKLIASGLCCTDILRGVSEAFAYQMYCSGIFNADPHPGKHS